VDLVLTLSCPDRVGVVHAVTGFLAAHDANIRDSQEYGDPDSGRFFMRVHVTGTPDLRAGFSAVAEQFGMEWALDDVAVQEKVLVLVSRQGHCLHDLLYRQSTGSLPADVVGVVSNHEDFRDLVERYGIPVLVKVIVRADDARRSVDAGAAGVIVSNHGARNLDTVVPTAQALPGVVNAVDGAVPVLVDGGIRRGTDVAKALALGATAVLVGRPAIWGLAVAGSAGVTWVVETLWSELAMAMGLLGAPRVVDLSPDVIWTG
jgi:NAD(P)H-dependent flavin oxidoreductase YrpB (nitropropane dioxygenase family)